MTTFGRHDAASPDPSAARDADRLGDTWDELVAGRRPVVAESDAELLAVIGQLSAEATQIRPTLTFRNALRETLMHHATAPMTAAPPAPMFQPVPKLGRSVEIESQVQRPAAAIPSRLQRVGARWAAMAATIALLLATAGGGYLASRGPGEGGATRVPGFAASPVASPEFTNDYVDPCPGQPYFPCGSVIDVGFAIVAGYLYGAESTTGTSVTMLGWEVGAGATVTFDPDDPQVVPGIAIDVVVDGAYAATFSGPVTVTRTHPGGASHTYPPAGELIELGPGDGVSFAQGTRVEVTNRLTSRPLVFKSVVIHGDAVTDTGEPGSGQSVKGNPGGSNVTIEEDGTGTLPMSIGQYPRQEFGIYLTYSQILPGSPLPTSVGDSIIVMGPVDPTNFFGSGPDPEEGTEGYILWTYMGKG